MSSINSSICQAHLGFVVRSDQKIKPSWFGVTIYSGKPAASRLELVVVDDMTADGAFDEGMRGSLTFVRLY